MLLLCGLQLKAAASWPLLLANTFCLFSLPSCRSFGVAWTFNKCDFDDFDGYASAADAVLTARGIDLSKYKYR